MVAFLTETTDHATRDESKKKSHMRHRNQPLEACRLDSGDAAARVGCFLAKATRRKLRDVAANEGAGGGRPHHR
ncbi:hypothetical protein GCM10009804_11390 [Kribbella hippodromi]|uniref:Uncharacterized protein n=1 Tax=Kribbella hippodromi TaxID=434347 RepID=A0ABN2CEG7_9ACTN